jgi:hypothetical protein
MLHGVGAAPADSGRSVTKVEVYVENLRLQADQRSLMR